MEEVMFRLGELPFPSITDVEVLPVAVNDEALCVEARNTVAGAICPAAPSVYSRAQKVPVGTGTVATNPIVDH
ncbi:hypothetical protein [Streptomyces sp. NPDC006134]|uniref:hypothetical protein n=1 Tax=Streptomyces sp. NPDC006134 TaxID=3154467 RepID=UPI0033E421FA